MENGFTTYMNNTLYGIRNFGNTDGNTNFLMNISVVHTLSIMPLLGFGRGKDTLIGVMFMKNGWKYVIIVAKKIMILIFGNDYIEAKLK